MHYANGQEAKAGDLVFKSSKASYDNEIIGILVSAQAGSTSCNGQVATVLMRGKSDCGDSPWLPVAGGGNTWCVTVGDLLPVAMPTLPDPPVTGSNEKADAGGAVGGSQEGSGGAMGEEEGIGEMSEQDVQAKLGQLVQQYAATKKTVESLRSTLGKLSVLFADLARSLPADQIKGDPVAAHKALASIPSDWTVGHVRDLLVQYQEASGDLVGLQEQLKPYGLS